MLSYWPTLCGIGWREWQESNLHVQVNGLASFQSWTTLPSDRGTHLAHLEVYLN